MSQTQSDSAQALVELEEGIANLQLITQTFTSLSLHDRPAVADTLLALLKGFSGASAGFVLLVDERSGELRVGARQDGPKPGELLSPERAALWREILAAHETRSVEPDAWKGDERLLVTPISIREQAVALIALAKPPADSFTRAQRTLVATAAVIGGQAMASGDAIREQERHSARAERDAREKAKLSEDLDRQLRIAEAQHQEIVELSSSVLELWGGVVLVPLVGTIDTQRGSEITERVLTALTSKRAHYVLLDVTGVQHVDTNAINQLLRMVGSVKLLGAKALITGIRPELAQTMIGLGFDVSTIRTARSLREGLHRCLREMGLVDRSA